MNDNAAKGDKHGEHVCDYYSLIYQLLDCHALSRDAINLNDGPEHEDDRYQLAEANRIFRYV